METNQRIANAALIEDMTFRSCVDGVVGYKIAYFQFYRAYKSSRNYLPDRWPALYSPYIT